MLTGQPAPPGGTVDLYHAGWITGTRKQLNSGKFVGTFALGSRYLYDAICGLVNLKGKSAAERAKASISIAHPDFLD